jgi:uncharacterized glyoxalase superfamily metalloenzyme YdcJ
MLVTEDRRFFDAATQKRLEAFIADRQLFGPELLALADRAVEQGGLDEDDAERLLGLATDAFRLTAEPIDRDWYDTLERISAVAADIGGVPATHINHLTPRVLDIDELYQRMQARGIAMIDEIQGPPDWEGPDVLLRQTSFRALAEERVFRHADGSIQRGSLPGATCTTVSSSKWTSAWATDPLVRTSPARCGGRACPARNANSRCRGSDSSRTGSPRWRRAETR